MTLSRASTNLSQSSHPPQTTTTDSIKAEQSAINPSGNAAESPAWLAGHLNHLTPEQEEAFKAFKTACTEKELYTPPQDGKSASHDDATLLYEGIFSSSFFLSLLVFSILCFYLANRLMDLQTISSRA